MIVQMQQRRGTAALWASDNPLLADGEMGLETDTLSFKFGNGVDLWNALEYAGSGGGGGGADGLPGWTWRGQWTSASAYSARDAVHYAGRAFYALVANNNSAPPSTATSNTTWSLIVDKGADGAGGSGGSALANSIVYRRYANGAYPVRGTLPTGTMVQWIGPTQPTIGGDFALTDVDIYTATPA